jgi:uncharacterized protein (TIGR01777 family)
MTRVELESEMPVSAEQLFAWHSRPGAFERLAPPWEEIRVLERRGTIRDGDRLVLELRMGPFPVRWVALHRDCIDGRQFVDVQESGPFAEWTHLHRFTPQEEHRSLLLDRIDYRLPLGALGALVAGRGVRGMLEKNLRFRHRRTRGDLERHRAMAEPKRIVVTGSSGLVGSALVPFLTTGGHRVDRLVRRTPAPDSTEIRWDPARGEIEAGALEGADAVVHLAGESIAAGPWTEERKRAIRDSRVESTRLLSETLAGLRTPPKVLVSASAVGYYGDRGDEELTEESAPGTGFLSDVSRQWEAAAAPAENAGIRVARLRIGVVQSATGGMLAKLLTPFKLGAGGPIGSGRQWVSWIALDDLVGAIHLLLSREDLSGPFNATAPNPVTNAEYARTLARVLRRPAFFPLPAAVVKTLFGEMGEATILSGQRVLPARLQAAGFEWRFPELEGALRAELGS